MLNQQESLEGNVEGRFVSNQEKGIYVFEETKKSKKVLNAYFSSNLPDILCVDFSKR